MDAESGTTVVFDGYSAGSAMLADYIAIRQGERNTDSLADSVNRKRNAFMRVVRAARFVAAIPSEAARIEYLAASIRTYHNPVI